MNTNLKYSLVTDKDIDVIRTTMLISKINSNQVAKLLSQAYENADDKDIYTKLSYGLFNLYANTAQDVLESKVKIEASLTAFEEISEANPDYWIAKLYIIRILLMLPSNYRNNDEIVDQLEEMIDIQSNSEYQPYFIAPYLLFAKMYLSLAEFDNAKQWISQAEKLKKEKITGLSAYIRPIFDNLEKTYRILKYTKEAENILSLRNEFIS